MKRAALVLATSVALFVSGTHAATRVSTPEKPFSSIMNAATGAIGLPYGDPAFFGPEFTAEHTAGSRFQAGSITGQLPPGSAPKVKVPIKPVVTVNPAKLGQAVKNAIKGGGVPGLVATAAVVWAIDQIPGATVVDNMPYMQSIPGSNTFYTHQYTGITRYGSAFDACRYAIFTNGVIPSGVSVKATSSSGNAYSCVKTDPYSIPSTTYHGTAYRTDQNCQYGATNYQCNPTTTHTPFSDSDYDLLQDAISQVTNSDWLRDLTKAKCEGSLSPEACYQDLVDRRPNHGPSTQTITSPSVTTTTTNPDGTTSTTTKTTSNKYDYTYTHNSFDYKVTTTTTTTTDGKTTTEVTTAEPSSPDDPPQEEPKEEGEEEMPEVTDLYKPYLDKLADIKSDVAESPAVVPALGWSAWYSFGGGCSEITVDLPVIGSWSTDYCQYIYDWVRPILAFMFVVFTWHYCRELWSEAVTQARPM